MTYHDQRPGPGAPAVGRPGRAARGRPVYGRRRRLSVYLEPRDAWSGAYRSRSGVYWCPVPFLVVRWAGQPAPFGAVLVLAGLLSQVVGLPWPWSLLLVLHLAVPGAAMLWWGYREGRLWR